ncbi:MAG: ABC transporter permease [Candidatus Pacearchaeota archaeon]
MTSISSAFKDCLILTQRSLKHMTKNMDQFLSIIITPIMFLLLFRYVFGGAIDTGDTTYINFLIAGILVQTLAFGASNTAINLVVDLNRGVIDRFKSLPMFAPALLIGHIVADLIRNTLSAAILIGFSFLVGFRPTASPGEWFLVLGLLLLFTLAMSMLFAIVGLLAKSMEAVQWLSFVLVMPLTFASSAFVPTDSMPKLLRIFAENQPFTLVIEAMRAWLVGTPIGNTGWIAMIWCIGILIIALPLAIWLFNNHKGKE